ncbi:LOW QUALITY PROTEIN: hypothetical protein CFOL_v3_08795, partial [Cephalotus follicularis]
IQWPAPLRSAPKKKDSNKYCWYHCDHKQDTEECRHLKNQIKDLILKGHLRKYVDRKAPQERRERKEEEEQQPRAYAIQTFAMQQYPHSKMLNLGEEDEAISFSEADYEGVRLLHDDPVVVTLQMELFTMNRILIDSESSTDILKHAFDQLRIPTNQLRPVKTPLIGFVGEMVHPLGSIELSVVAGTAPRKNEVQMTFLVVDTPSQYNAIVGRSWLN